MAGLASGSLDRRIALLHDVGTTPNDVGAIVPNWQPLLTHIPAAKRDIGGREAERNPQVIAELDTIWQIRRVTVPIDTTMRLRDEHAREYEIRSIAEIGNREGYEILTRNLDAKGATA